MVTEDVKKYFLEHGRVATIATQPPQRGPEHEPAVVLWDARTEGVPDQHATRVRRKVKTLRRDPKMSLLIDDPLNNLGVYVLVYGTGEIIGPGKDATLRRSSSSRNTATRDEASLQHWKEINEDGQRVIIRMTPDEWHWRTYEV